MAQKPGRREMLRKAAYLAPLVVTLPVLPSFASAGSRMSSTGDDGEASGRRRRRRRFRRNPGRN
jgi:hypothetical protein